MAKKVTLETIAKSINDLSEDLNGKIEKVAKSVDDLATITKTEFDNVHKEFGNVHKEIKGLKQGQENIELRLANVAYRFELQELEQRVSILEDKAGVKYKK